MSDPLSQLRQSDIETLGGGYRVVWTHSTSGDVFTGDYWPDLESASYIAQMLQGSEWCRNVWIRKAAV